MAQHILELLRGYLAHYGYWTVAAALLLENAGVPVPGETILLLASFLAYSEHHLHLGYIILVGICAATIGDNLGFAIGYHGGRPLLERYQHIFHIPQRTLARGEHLFQRYGAATIFVARFIAGMRIIAGPLAGVLRMDWRKFALYNFLGAALWVSVISAVGYFFGKYWDDLMQVMHGLNLVLLAVAAAVALWLWRRWRKTRQESDMN
ncbi:MAG: DedA family protein [Acidobacteriia bacterium]|nr:DedA family protein [Terriglobia bacterium]